MNMRMKNKMSKLSRIKNTHFEGANSVEKFSTVLNSYVGFGTYISSRSKLINCKIGKYCSIASKVEIIFGKHPTNTFVSTSPAFYSINTLNNLSFVKKNIFKEFDYTDQEEKYYVDIGNDVWIGYGCRIKGGVRIGDGAIIAAGSIVTKDVEPYSIVGGIPAKIIKYRFKDDEIKYLQNLEWWNKNIDWIKRHAKYFNNIDEFIKVIKNEEYKNE